MYMNLHVIYNQEIKLGLKPLSLKMMWYKKEALMNEREVDKLQKSLGGIQEMAGIPEAIFVVDIGYHKIALTEAKKLGIPVIAVVDTNHSPDGVDYIIPGNDDSSKAVALYVRGMADAILEGKASAMSQLVEAIKDPEEAIHEEGKAE